MAQQKEGSYEWRNQFCLTNLFLKKIVLSCLLIFFIFYFLFFFLGKNGYKKTLSNEPNICVDMVEF
jgi:uncharacterized protein YneF (UPF0154 family)